MVKLVANPSEAAKRGGDAEQSDRDPFSRLKTGMGTLGTGKRRRRDGWSGSVRAIPRLHLNLDALGTKELDTRMPMNPSTPVLPEERLTSDDEGMEEHADLARHSSGGAIPLALLAQRTGTTTADAGRVHDAQAAIAFPAPLMGDQLLACWTSQRPIGLERKVLPREPASFPMSLLCSSCLLCLLGILSSDTWHYFIGLMATSGAYCLLVWNNIGKQ